MNPALPTGQTAASIDAAFLAAQPDPVKKFMQNPQRTATQALALANLGYRIDTVTMYWGWSYTAQTQNRIAQGYAWIPNANMPPVTLEPGLVLEGFATYEPGMIPPGAIIVSLNPALFGQIFGPVAGSLLATNPTQALEQALAILEGK
jgi:hypothetical protein